MKWNLLFAKSSATVLSCAAFSYAGEVQAPPSIKGATITIEFEEANLIRRETLEYDEIIESAYSELVYVPKKGTALISFGYTHTGRRFYNFIVSGEDKHLANFEENAKPATITFSSKKGRIYQGKIHGYRTCDRGGGWDKLISITIKLPK